MERKDTDDRAAERSPPKSFHHQRASAEQEAEDQPAVKAETVAAELDSWMRMQSFRLLQLLEEAWAEGSRPQAADAATRATELEDHSIWARRSRHQETTEMPPEMEWSCRAGPDRKWACRMELVEERSPCLPKARRRADLEEAAEEVA